MASVKRAFHDTTEGQIHYRYIKTDRTPKKAPIIFLHQSASCGWSFGIMMKKYADRGHDCYAPDMPGFGCSYDPVVDPTSTRFYVNVFMNMIRALKLPKVHLFGHHAGSGMAMEMAAIYPEEILTVALSAPALATPEMQASMFVAIAGEWSKPQEDGSHLNKVWDVLAPLIPDLDTRNHEVLDALRAWKGRDQAYKVLFKQDKIGFYKQITCPILAMCSKEDILWPCFRFCSELQPTARCEVTMGAFLDYRADGVGSVPYYHMDFLDELGA